MTRENKSLQHRTKVEAACYEPCSNESLPKVKFDGGCCLKHGFSEPRNKTMCSMLSSLLTKSITASRRDQFIILDCTTTLYSNK